MTDLLTITLPATVHRDTKLEGRITSHEPTIRRATVWLFGPGVFPVPGGHSTWLDLKPQRLWARSVHPLRRPTDPPDTRLGMFRKAITERFVPGVYTVVAHVPKEPGSAFGDYVQAKTFEVVTNDG